MDGVLSSEQCLELCQGYNLDPEAAAAKVMATTQLLRSAPRKLHVQICTAVGNAGKRQHKRMDSNKEEEEEEEEEE